MAVFVAPGKLFAALRDDPRWVAAAVLGAVLSTAATALIPTEMWVEAMRQAMLERGQTLPPDFDADAIGGFQKLFGVVWAALSWFIVVFVLAGVSSLLFAFLLGDRGGYREHLAVVSHALLVAAAGSLLVTPLRLLEGDVALSLNLGLFLPLEDGFLATFLRYLDLFWLWAFVLIGIGAHELDRRRSLGVALPLTLSLPVVVAILFAWFSRT